MEDLKLRYDIYYFQNVELHLCRCLGQLISIQIISPSSLGALQRLKASKATQNGNTCAATRSFMSVLIFEVGPG